ncbi:MAG: SGNH/GDSL hydrolase family protein, partial [Gammaproteobacteria bacterium]
MTTLNKIAKGWGIFGIYLAITGAALYSVTSLASQDAVPAFVAMGDSIENGDGASPGSLGYVPQFNDYLDANGYDQVELHNLSASGAPTRDIALNQLAPAIAEILNHREFGVVLIWGGGADDLLDFIRSPQAHSCLQNQSCLARINALLNEVERTVDLTLKTLRYFAG